MNLDVLAVMAPLQDLTKVTETNRRLYFGNYTTRKCSIRNSGVDNELSTLRRRDGRWRDTSLRTNAQQAKEAFTNHRTNTDWDVDTIGRV